MSLDRCDSCEELVPTFSYRAASQPALFEIEIENGHVEIIGQLAILIVAEDHPDEFVANIDLRRVVFLRTPANFDISELEFGPEELGKLLYFIGLHNDVP